ncbi:MAG: hypothetical protein NVV62_07270 [Terricaulis sp.]|nr:hypothetical protein [Terricaulis sp.]
MRQSPWEDTPNYIRLDEKRAIALLLRQASRALDGVHPDKGEWILAVESLHAAAQVAMAAHLSGSARVGAQTLKGARAALDGERSKERTAEFPILLQRIVGKLPPIEGGGAVLRLPENVVFHLTSLNELRIGLVHMMPVGWSIQIELAAEASRAAVFLIRSIVQDGYIFRVDENDQERLIVSEALREVDEKLQDEGVVI